MLLGASKARGVETNNENALVESGNEDMETESVMHYNNSGDTWSESEVFLLKFKANSEKKVYALFKQFKTDDVHMAKLDQLLMQKGIKNIYAWKETRI